MSRTTHPLSLRTAALAVVTAVASLPLLAAPAYASSPTVASVAPSSRPQGAAPVAVTITGTDLRTGATVDFGPGIAVSYSGGSSTANGTFTQLTGVTITVAADAPTGPHLVRVTNPDAGTASCSCFTVTAAPTIASVTPSAGNPGQNVNVTISGSGFQTGASVTAGSGITVTNVTRVDAATMTATFQISPGALSGARDVRVVNPDGSSAQRNDSFTVGNAVAVTGVSPNTRGRGAQNQTVVITGTNFASGAVVSFSGGGITVDSVTFVSSSRLDAVIDVASGAALGQRNVTVTNPGGLAGTCTGCFNVTGAPTVTAAAPTSLARGQQARDVTITGTGFLAGATVNFGADITVTSVNVSSSTSLVARVNVDVDAVLGARNVSVSNPDGGTGSCTGCFSVTAGRALVVELIDTKGTTTTTDDSLTTRPVSGTTYVVRVTAKIAGTGSNTDTTYTRVPVLTSDDTTFVNGTCSAAVNGVATCTGVRFGDLGAKTLAAQGASAADSDRNGTLAVVVQPTGLTFTASPTTGEIGQTLTYTVVPSVGITGAKIAGYTATRTLQITGTGSSSADNTTLNCPTATCTFTLSFSQAGTKTVAVTDNGTPSRSTPVVTVQIGAAVERGTYTPLVPARVLDTRTANDGDAFSSPIGGGGIIDVPLTGRGGVPTSGVSAVVVNATAVRPTTDGFVTLYPTGTTRPNASTLNFLPGQVVPNLAVVKVGTNGRISVFNLKGATHVVLDVVGWYSTTEATTGGRTVAVTPSRILDTRPDSGDDVSTPVGANSSITRQILGAGGVPTTGVTAVIVNVTAVRPTAGTFVTAYPSDAARPNASTLNLDPSYRIAGRVPDAVANLAIVKLGSDGRIALFNNSGQVDLILDVVGYVSGTSQATAGRFVALAPTRVLDTRVANDGDLFSAPIGAGSAIDVTLVGRGGVPSSGVTAVVLNVTAIGPSASTYLTVYPTGETRPTASNVNAVPTQIVPNLVVVKLGSNGQAGIYNRSGTTHVAADVVGYLTS